DVIRVKILEIDSERRRLSLSAKRVEDQELPLRSAGEPPPAEGEGEEIGEVRDLELSDDVFTGAEEAGGEGAAEAAEPEPAPEAGEPAPEAEPAETAPDDTAEPVEPAATD